MIWNQQPADDGRNGSTDLSQVLVVAHSNINRVVVSKIIERCGLKPFAYSPDAAADVLADARPGIVILDGGADNRDCDCLLAGLTDQRRVSANRTPRVILLSTVNGSPESFSLSPAIDAVVAKPITPEVLQPVVDRLLNSARG